MEINGAKSENISDELANRIEFSMNVSVTEIMYGLYNNFSLLWKYFLKVLKEAFQNYATKAIFLSFNGGKDCTVLLNLLKEHLSSDEFKSLKVIYLRQKYPFPEIDSWVERNLYYFFLFNFISFFSFVQDCEKYYEIDIHTVESDASMKQILKTGNSCATWPSSWTLRDYVLFLVCDSDKDLAACIMGCRWGRILFFKLNF